MNEERTGRRSLAFSKWHRETFPDHYSTIDIDLMGFCHIKGCRVPLWAVEDTEQYGDKPTSLLRSLCNAAGLIGVLVYVDIDPVDDSVMGLFAEQVHPARLRIGGADDLAAFLEGVRAGHILDSHGIAGLSRS